MAFGKITVHGPPNRDLFVNELRNKPKSRTNESGLSIRPIKVEYGENLIETLDENKKPDFAGTVTVNKQNPNPVLKLMPVAKT